MALLLGPKQSRLAGWKLLSIHYGIVPFPTEECIRTLCVTFLGIMSQNGNNSFLHTGVGNLQIRLFMKQICMYAMLLTSGRCNPLPTAMAFKLAKLKQKIICVQIVSRAINF